MSCPRRQAREAAEPRRQHGESDGQLFLPTGGRRLESEEEATGAARRGRRRRGERREEPLWVVAEPSETIEDACADVCRRPGPCNATCVTECDVSMRNRLRWWVKAQKAKALMRELRRRRQDSHPANFAVGALGGFLAGFAVAWVLRG